MQEADAVVPLLGHTVVLNPCHPCRLDFVKSIPKHTLW